MNVLDVLLAAGPAVTAQQAAPVVVPPVAAPFDMTAIYVLVGMFVLKEIGKLAVDIVRGLGARTVNQEDEAKKAMKASLEEHDEKFEEVTRTLDAVTRDNKTIAEATTAISAMVKEIKEHVETRFDKQAEFYRGQIKDATDTYVRKLSDMEQTLRRDMQRAIHDAEVMREEKERTKKRAR